MGRRIRKEPRMEKLYSEEDIKKEFNMISDNEFRDAVENLKLPSYLYGEAFPEKEHLLINE